MVGRKKKVILTQVTDSISAEGEVLQIQTDLGYLLGMLSPTSGRKTFSEGKWRVYASHTFITEYPIPYVINEKCFIKVPSTTRIFDIQSVDNVDEQNMYLKMDLLERT